MPERAETGQGESCRETRFPQERRPGPCADCSPSALSRAVGFHAGRGAGPAARTECPAARGAGGTRGHAESCHLLPFPFQPLPPAGPLPTRSPAPLGRGGSRSHLPNTFRMLSLILHRQHLREQKQIFSKALSCTFYRKLLAKPVLIRVRWGGPCQGLKLCPGNLQTRWSCVWHRHGLI